MTGAIIQVVRKWTLGEQIGHGGYGRVFEATDERNDIAAVKLIPKAPGADRELLFVDLKGVRNVMPILEAREWNDHWVLVMPRADKSLRDQMNEHGPLPIEAFALILTDLAQALSDMQKHDIVHRDIKPDNLLLWDGHWCLSDFGIARYSDAATASSTHKRAWSRPYNAPERWRDERATPAADIYSTGIMAFEMLTARLPFSGPDFRSQHLNEEPPRLEGVPAVVDSLVVECLHKSPEARPSAANLLSRIDRIRHPVNPSTNLLQEANQVAARRRAREAAASSKALSENENRTAIVSDATRILGIIFERFTQEIRDNAPQAGLSLSHSLNLISGSIRLESAELSVSKVSACPDDAWREWSPAFHVYAFASISL